MNNQGTIDAHSQICLGVDQDPQGPDLRRGSCEMQGPALHKIPALKFAGNKTNRGGYLKLALCFINQIAKPIWDICVWHSYKIECSKTANLPIN